MYRVLIRDNMAPVARQLLEATGRIEVVVDNDKATGTPEKLVQSLNAFDGIAIRSGTRIPAEVLDQVRRLRVIGRAGVGVDNIDVEAATRKGIVVMNAPGGNTITTAEHTIALLLSMARNLPQGTAGLKAGLWEKKNLTGVELTGKTLGIVGLGHVGRVVASLAQGLRMKVIASDPFVSPEAAQALQVELLPTDDLYARADIISLHVPRLKETFDMINAESLARMKPGVRIINCSRGEVVDLAQLYAALESGHVAGAALDVFPVEPPDAALPILHHPRVIFTPHLGASTEEAQVKVAEMIARQMAAYLINDVIVHAVNFPSVSREVMARIRPYLELGEKMGALMGQLVDRVYDLTLTYAGDVAELETRPLTHAILKGFLGVFTDKPVNYVNARSIAKEKGIGVKESLSKDRGDYTGTIRLRLEGFEGGPRQIWGTIFSEKHPRIVRLGDIYLDAIPEGSMIIIQNVDRPGVIGNVGATLGRHQINIGRFQLGRRGDRATCMVTIDTPAGDEVIEDIRALPNMLSVQQVHLGTRVQSS
jgi:D-3-phosphoglycerate dehydrogenase